MESDGFKSEDMTRPRSPRLVHEQSNQLGGAEAGEANAMWARLRDSNRCSIC